MKQREEIDSVNIIIYFSSQTPEYWTIPTPTDTLQLYPVCTVPSNGPKRTFLQVHYKNSRLLGFNGLVSCTIR